MSRFVAAGIACKILICKKKYVKDEAFNELREEMKGEVEKHIDANTYNVEEGDNYICYRIKEDFVNEHLHELLKEINPILNIKQCFLSGLYYDECEEIDVYSDDFNRDNYNFKLKYFDKNYNFDSEYERHQFANNYAILEGTKLYSLDLPFFTENLWIVCMNRKLFNNVRIDISYILLWVEPYKYPGEDESFIIRLLNIFSRNYFKNPLSKNLQFYISG